MEENYKILNYNSLMEKLESLKSKPENLQEFNEIQQEINKRDELRKEFELKRELSDCFLHIKGVWEDYMDMQPHYYPIVVCWTIGTYFHEQMLTYPFLYFHAGKGSGKTRAAKLIAFFSKDGEVNNNMTEAVLFRTKGTLVIDEFEGIGRKGIENFRELCNAAYKKGSKIKRMRKRMGKDGEEQVVEEFSVFRPLAMANIWGMEDVLGDRCLPIYLEKTTLKKVNNLMEIFDIEPQNIQIKEKIKGLCSLCNVVTSGGIPQEWNRYVQEGAFEGNTSEAYNYTNIHLFNKIEELKANGRMLELTFPLLIIASMMTEEIFEEVFESLKIIVQDKIKEEYIENRDVYFMDFVSQQPPSWNNQFVTIRKIASEFKNHLNTNEDWLNEKWIGKAIRRLSLSKDKKRMTHGIEVILDVKKAQEKMEMFK